MTRALLKTNRQLCFRNLERNTSNISKIIICVARQRAPFSLEFLLVPDRFDLSNRFFSLLSNLIVDQDHLFAYAYHARNIQNRETFHLTNQGTNRFYLYCPLLFGRYTKQCVICKVKRSYSSLHTYDLTLIIYQRYVQQIVLVYCSSAEIVFPIRALEQNR